MRRFVLSLGCSPLMAFAVCLAQSASPAPPPQTAPTSSAPAARASAGKTKQEKEIEKQEQSQRTLGILPQFMVTNRQNASPLTPGEKFRLFAKDAFDPVEFAVTGAQAGLSQAEDEFPGYGQGGKGYAKRYGAALGDEVSSGFWSNFFYPTLLKEDPRYFRVGEGGFKHRLVYSVKQELVCHTDKGGRSFNYSNVLGAFTAGGLSNLYYPQDDRGFGLTMSRVGIALAYGVAGSLFNEFGPDVHRKLLHKHQKGSQKP